MLLKRMDEILQAGNYDCRNNATEAEVTLVEPRTLDKLVHWDEVAGATVPLAALHYDDTSDSGQAASKKFKSLYTSQNPLGTLYKGSDFLFQNDLPVFSGIAKAAIYIRYSQGFLDWLTSFDLAMAQYIKTENSWFQTFVSEETQKFPQTWHDFKTTPGQWMLVAITKLTNGQHLVPFLTPKAAEDDNRDILENDLGIDVPHSLELMAYFTAKLKQPRKVISAQLQMDSGLGRTPFWKKPSANAADSEYLRTRGIIPESVPTDLLSIWNRKLLYQIKFSPNPDASNLLFLPEGDLKYSELKAVIDSENERKKLFGENKKQKKTAPDAERETADLNRPAVIPAVSRCTVFMVNIEGNDKPKFIVQRIFPSVEVAYFCRLNQELLVANPEKEIIPYMQIAITGQKRSSPCVYSYWTDVLNRSLLKQPISGREVYRRFAQFIKNQKLKDLIDDQKANDYFKVIGKLLRLQRLITAASQGRESLAAVTDQELQDIENFKTIPQQGVFGIMKETLPSLSELLGESSGMLRSKEQEQFETLLKRAWGGIPSEDFTIFAHGAIVGILLESLRYSLERAGRSFQITQGRHPTCLRGEALESIFCHGVGLLSTLNETNLFNCQMLPFIHSIGAESHLDTFNNGFVIGLTSRPKFNANSNDSDND